jgi:tRNA (mo5U34)-methyltransferase
MSTLRTLQSHGPSEGALADEIRALGPWFQNLHLPGGATTAPDHPLGDYPAFKWADVARHLPEDMTGLRALDIGCNAGFYSFEMARRGADVVAMDHDPRYLRQAEWAARQLGLEQRVHLRQADVYALGAMSERFDVVLFLGVFYHLRHPLLGLDLAASVCTDRLLFQSFGIDGPADCEEASRDPGYLGRDLLRQDAWPKMAFVEHELAGDPSNWWLPNPTAIDAMLRSCGFAIDAYAGDIRVARRTAQADDAARRTQAVLDALCGG